MIKAFVIDDHPLIREGLKQILCETSDISVEDGRSYGEEALRKVKKNLFDVAVLHTYSPGKRSLDFLKKLKVIKPELPVLILNMRTEEDYGLRYLKAGASGCLAEECNPDELKEAIRELANGEKYISPSLAEKIAFNLIKEEGKLPHDALSNREYQVMCLIASGKRIKDIAKELARSVKTISTHRSRVLKKMNMKNNVQLIYYAIKNNLIE